MKNLSAKQAFSILEMSIVILVVSIISSLTFLNYKSLIAKASCVVSEFGTKKTVDNIDNLEKLNRERTNSYEVCAKLASGINIDTRTIRCSGSICTSCNEALDYNPGAPSGVYFLDPDGVGGNADFEAYCDMKTDGGGWTLLLKNVTNSSNFDHGSSSWTTGTTFNVSDFNLWTGSNSLYQSYNTVTGNQFKLQFESNGSIIINVPTVNTAKEYIKGPTYRELRCYSSSGCWNNSNTNCTNFRSTFDPSWRLNGGYVEKSINGTGFAMALRFGIMAGANSDGSSIESMIGIGIGSTYSVSSGFRISGGANNICDYPSSSAINTTVGIYPSAFWKALLWVR